MEEKIYFKNSEGTSLCGILHLPEKETDKIVIISHGSCTCKDRDRFIRLSQEINQKGLAALRFDFGGSGESDAREITLEGQVLDLKAAIDFSKKKGFDRIGLFGESLGGLTSILAFNESVNVLVLWAPITYGNEPSMLKKEEYNSQLKEKGYIVFERRDVEFKFPLKYFEERKKIDQKSIMSKINCPTLIIQGTSDNTVDQKKTKESLNYIESSEKEIFFVEGGTHELKNVLDEIVPLTAKWFKEKLI